MWWQTVLVIVIVAGVGLLAVRSLYRTLTGKDGGCTCGWCDRKSCPLSDSCDATEKGRPGHGTGSG